MQADQLISQALNLQLSCETLHPLFLFHVDNQLRLFPAASNFPLLGLGMITQTFVFMKEDSVVSYLS
jgi:hypothetical protein